VFLVVVYPGGYFSISLEPVDFIDIQVHFLFAEPDIPCPGLCDPELLFCFQVCPFLLGDPYSTLVSK
jgi:hypothetical protein